MSNSTAVGSPQWLSPASDERVSLRAAPSGKLVLAALGGAFAIQVGTVFLIGIVEELRTARLLMKGMVVLTLGMLLFAYVIVLRRDYVLTDARAYVGVGVLSKRIESVELDRVEEIDIDQPAWQPWVQIGTIRFVTSEGEVLTFAFVENPYDLYRRVVQHAPSRA